MATEFDELFSRNAVPILARHLGDSGSAVYMPDDTRLRDIPLQHAIISDERAEEHVTDDGIRVRRVRTITIFTDRNHANFSGVESPVINDGIAYGDSIYAVIDVLRHTYGGADLKIQQMRQREITKPGFRRTVQ